MKTSILNGVLGALFVTRCSNSPWDPTLTYGTEVKIHSGFFAGSTGVIEAQTWQYHSDACNTAAFKVSVYNEKVGVWEDVQIAQTNLEKQ